MRQNFYLGHSSSSLLDKFALNKNRLGNVRKFWATNFVTKVAKIFADILGYFEKVTSHEKLLLKIWATFVIYVARVKPHV